MLNLIHYEASFFKADTLGREMQGEVACGCCPRLARVYDRVKAVQVTEEADTTQWSGQRCMKVSIHAPCNEYLESTLRLKTI